MNNPLLKANLVLKQIIKILLLFSVTYFISCSRTSNTGIILTGKHTGIILIGKQISEGYVYVISDTNSVLESESIDFTFSIRGEIAEPTTVLYHISLIRKKASRTQEAAEKAALGDSETPQG